MKIECSKQSWEYLKRLIIKSGCDVDQIEEIDRPNSFYIWDCGFIMEEMDVIFKE